MRERFRDYMLNRVFTVNSLIYQSTWPSKEMKIRVSLPGVMLTRHMDMFVLAKIGLKTLIFPKTIRLL